MCTTWMSCALWHMLLDCLLVISISLQCNGTFCPNQRVEVLANSKTFDETLSTGSCSHNCSAPDCVVSVSQPEGFNVTRSGCSSIRVSYTCRTFVSVVSVSQPKGFNVTVAAADCFNIAVQGNTPSPGDTEVLLKYQFLCNDFSPPPIRTGTGYLLIRAIELELTLDRYKSNISQPVMILYGSTLNISCLTHLTDSSDIPVMFHYSNGNKTHRELCPATLCSSFPEIGWRICRNTTRPHNCILVLYDFGDSDDGAYTCSTDIAGKDDESNSLTLLSLHNIEPANEVHHKGPIIIVIVLSIVCVVLLTLLGLIFIGFKYVKSRRSADPIPPLPEPVGDINGHNGDAADDWEEPLLSEMGASHSEEASAGDLHSGVSGSSQPQFSFSDPISCSNESSEYDGPSSATVVAAPRFVMFRNNIARDDQGANLLTVPRMLNSGNSAESNSSTSSLREEDARSIEFGGTISTVASDDSYHTAAMSGSLFSTNT